tara:strand:+ start:317 stop:1666 length:1350 start_codon:yes stop_codon:yes gene_type:complete
MLKKTLLFTSILIIICLFSTLTHVDRTPYKELDFYKNGINEINQLLTKNHRPSIGDTLLIGFAKVNLTPSDLAPLAGYGNRRPKEMTRVHDSIFVNTTVINNGKSKIAMVSADLLIIPPKVTLLLKEKLFNIDWSLPEVFLSATHTHSSLGGWAPGLVGNMIAGAYDAKYPELIANRIIESIQMAEKKMNIGAWSFNELYIPSLIRNRLVGTQGITDSSLKIIAIKSGMEEGIHAFYGAHATCLSGENKQMSRDYPGVFSDWIVNHTPLDFAIYSAGAVASMGPEIGPRQGFDRSQFIGEEMAKQVALIQQFGFPYENQLNLKFLRIPLFLRQPMVKISENWALRPWVFNWIFGHSPLEISMIQLNDLIIIGLPCDFSGELAVELYTYAKTKNQNLIISSFNGGYAGYVPDDQWYDLEKYETRSMSWYGHDNGAYFVEIVKLLIDNNQL